MSQNQCNTKTLIFHQRINKIIIKQLMNYTNISNYTYSIKLYNISDFNMRSFRKSKFLVHKLSRNCVHGADTDLFSICTHIKDCIQTSAQWQCPDYVQLLICQSVQPWSELIFEQQQQQQVVWFRYSNNQVVSWKTRSQIGSLLHYTAQREKACFLGKDNYAWAYANRSQHNIYSKILLGLLYVIVLSLFNIIIQVALIVHIRIWKLWKLIGNLWENIFP